MLIAPIEHEEHSPFLYDPEGELFHVEELNKYADGTLYPVHLGDVFSSQTSTTTYQVIMKIGHGSYSTVWLAQDMACRYDAFGQFRPDTQI